MGEEKAERVGKRGGGTVRNRDEGVKGRKASVDWKGKWTGAYKATPAYLQQQQQHNKPPSTAIQSNTTYYNIITNTTIQQAPPPSPYNNIQSNATDNNNNITTNIIHHHQTQQQKAAASVLFPSCQCRLNSIKIVHDNDVPFEMKERKHEIAIALSGMQVH